MQADVLDMTLTDRGLVFAQLSQARNSGANLGKGRVYGLFSSGCSRLVLEFEEAIVQSLSWLDGLHKGPVRFNLELSVGSLVYHPSQ
jgi:hypothetical protein